MSQPKRTGFRDERMPQALCRAIFQAAWQDEAGWPGPHGVQRRSQLRLLCRDARAGVDGAIKKINVDFTPEHDVAALRAIIRTVGAGRFPELRRWRVSLRGAPDAEIMALAQAIPRSLRTLQFYCDRLGLDAESAPLASAFAGAPGMLTLRELILRKNEIKGANVAILAQGFGPSLELLDLHFNDSSAAGAAALAAAAAARLPALRELNLSSNLLGDAGVQELVRVKWGALTGLDLHRNNITHVGAAALGEAGAARLPALRKLRLSDNDEIGDAGVESLMQRPWPQLQQLHLTSSGIREEGAAALNAAAEAHRLPRLHSLLLGQNRLGADGVHALLQPAPWTGLQSLNLSYNFLQEHAMAELATASRSQLPALRNLSVRNNPLGDSIAAFAGGDWHLLEVLEVTSYTSSPNDADVNIIRPLAAAGAARFPALRRLRLPGMNVSEEQIAALSLAWAGQVEVHTSA